MQHKITNINNSYNNCYESVFTAKKKGVSPMIATTILLTIAIAVSSVIFFWQSSMISNVGSNIEDQTNLALKCQHAGLIIESASYSCSGNCNTGINHTISLRLRNYGSIDLQTSSVAVITSTGNLFSFPFPSQILAGESVTYSNISSMSCAEINHTIESIRVLTNCPDVQAYTSGDDIVWLNC